MPHKIAGRYTAVVATEIEFYLFGAEDRDMTRYWQAVRGFNLPIVKIEKEQSYNQFEISLRPTSNIERIISDTERLRTIITALTSEHKVEASFEAKPIPHEQGSGLHVHVHLEDESGRNVYYKDDDQMSNELAYSIGGLLANLKKDLPIFTPTEQGKQRLLSGGYVPSTVSWGANNRSCAIRLPDKPHDNKHIEHRVSSADADVESVVYAILNGIEDGIVNRIAPPKQIFGNASLPMYGLPKLIDA